MTNKEVKMQVEQVLSAVRAPRPRVVRPIVMIGAGGIAENAHLPAYRKAEFPVAVVSDLHKARAEALAAQFVIPRACGAVEEAVHAAPEDAIYDVTVPAPALRSVLHTLPDGVAVLLQKPMGETLAEATEILQICREKKLTAAVNFQLRWAPAIMAARALRDAGLLGEVNDCEVSCSMHTPWELWSFLKTAPRLEILYHSIHYIDLIRSWFGNPSGVWAQTVRSPRAAELAATRTVAAFDFGESKRVFLATNHGHDFDTEKQRSWVQWEGSQGAVCVQMGVNLDYPRGRPDTLKYVLRDGGGWRPASVAGNWFPDAFLGPMGALQSFVAGESTELPTSVEDAIDTMRTVEAAYRSSASGGEPLP